MGKALVDQIRVRYSLSDTFFNDNAYRDLSFSSLGVEKMTVLLEENAVCESSSAPPRKKLCLSLSGKGKLTRESANVNGNISDGNNFKEEYQKSNISPANSNSATNFKSNKDPSTTLENCENSLK